MQERHSVLMRWQRSKTVPHDHSLRPFFLIQAFHLYKGSIRLLYLLSPCLASILHPKMNAIDRIDIYMSFFVVANLSGNIF